MGTEYVIAVADVGSNGFSVFPFGNQELDPVVICRIKGHVGGYIGEWVGEPASARKLQTKLPNSRSAHAASFDGA
jgi:hypothetical protein